MFDKELNEAIHALDQISRATSLGLLAFLVALLGVLWLWVKWLERRPNDRRS